MDAAPFAAAGLCRSKMCWTRRRLFFVLACVGTVTTLLISLYEYRSPYQRLEDVGDVVRPLSRQLLREWTLRRTTQRVDVGGNGTRRHGGRANTGPLLFPDIKIFVHELPPRFNTELVDFVEQRNRCFKLSEHGMGPEMARYEIGDSTTVSLRDTHQFSLEVIFHSRLLKSVYRTLNASEADVFYIPYYHGLSCFHDAIVEAKEGQRPWLERDLTADLWQFLENNEFYQSQKPHVMALGKIEREHFDPRCSFLKDRRANSISYIGIEEEKKQFYREKAAKRGNQRLIVSPYPSYGHIMDPVDSGDNETTYLSYGGDTDRDVLVLFAGSEYTHNKLRLRLKSELAKTKSAHEQFRPDPEANATKSGVWFVSNECSPTVAKNTMGWMRRSVFCLQPRGDSPTRKSFYDSVVSGCVPVIFSLGEPSVKYPFDDVLEYSEYTVMLREEDYFASNRTIVDILSEFSSTRITQMQRRLEDNMSLLQYTFPGEDSPTGDAFHMVVHEIQGRIREGFDR